jgi:HptB-dependent secretion and biofilm anti anti-sigma factor
MKFDFHTDGAVAFSGNLTADDYLAFRDVADLLRSAPAQPIVIDLSRLAFIDSAGLGMLLMVRDEAAKANRKMVLRNPRGQVKRLFTANKFDSLFTIEGE